MALELSSTWNFIITILLTVGKIVMYILGGTAIIGGVLWYLNKKKYDTLVRVYEENPKGSGILEECEQVQGGIFLDRKTKFRLFKLKKLRVGLSPDKIPYINSTRFKKVVNVLRLGLKSYRFLDKPVMATNSPICVNYGVQDEDVAWALNEVEKGDAYLKLTIWDKAKPFIGMAFVFLTVIVALYFVIVKAGFNAELLTRLADTSQAISENLARANLGTVVVE